MEPLSVAGAFAFHAVKRSACSLRSVSGTPKRAAGAPIDQAAHAGSDCRSAVRVSDPA